MQQNNALLLFERVRAGETDAVDSIVRLAWPSFRSAHTLNAKGFDRAEFRTDVASEIILAAHDYQPTRDGAFTDYALTRARRHINALLKAEQRRHARVSRLTEEVQDRLGTEMTTRFATEVENPQLASALRRLSPRLRAVIVRLYWQEYSINEIASAEGCAPTAVRQARRRAEATLRHLLKKDPRTV